MIGEQRSSQQAAVDDTAAMADALQGIDAEASARDIAQDLKGVAGDLKEAAVEHTRAIFETARSQATGFADQRKDEAAQSVSDIAASLRETGRTFGERPNIQAFVGSAADGLDQLAGSIRERSFADIYADVEAYARRSPVTVGFAAAIAGFALARFIKSSGDDLSASSVAAREDAATARRTARVADPSAA